MKVLIIGEGPAVEELKQRLGDQHEFWTEDAMGDKTAWDVLFDLSFEEQTEAFEVYRKMAGKTVFVHALTTSFAELYAEMGGDCDSKLIGFNGLPTFIDRSDWEVKAWDESQKADLEEVCDALGVKARWVKDRVGMIVPRTLFMIINEACYTLQEGTANIADIDLAMKLGTNYPYGPFEWADRIGIQYVYETLEAMYQDTHEPRYKICPLLKTHYLRNQPFHA